MKRAFHFLLALAAFLAGLWCFYAGYEREVSLSGRTETGLTYLKTGLDGKTRVLTHHWYYGIGAALLIGSAWWLLHGHKPARRRRR
ncbi:MAG: hypothetical protein JSS11_03475 [Verrucomicrobia bacterium]|nr:hypothetical protein [Verrucomicrobiota bacterium]